MGDKRLLEGVTPHGNGFRVRVRFGSGRRVSETFRTAEEANARVLELGRRKRAGQGPPAPKWDPTLREAADELLEEKSTKVSVKSRKKLSSGTIRWWKLSLKPWREGSLADLPISLLVCESVEQQFLARAAEAPKVANDELGSLKATLRKAERKGAVYDKRLLQIEKVAYVVRERHALSVEELQFFLARAPEVGRDLLLINSTVGNRITELLTLEEDRVDLTKKTMFIPAHLNKERRDKTIDLTDEECEVFVDVLTGRRQGSRHVFVKEDGRPWLYERFHKRIWAVTLSRAIEEWATAHGLDDHAPSPFVWPLYDEEGSPILGEDGVQKLGHLQPHDLRATAVTMMRDAGFTRDQAAARVGHGDQGDLVDGIYDKGDRQKRSKVREAIEKLPGDGVLSSLKGDGKKRKSRSSKP